MSNVNSKIADPKLADAGRLRIEWAESRMPVLVNLRDKGKKDLPLRGMKVAGCLHVTKETAVLIRTIRAAGAEVSWSGCNPLSTQDDVAAALAAEGTSIYAWHGLTKDEFYWCIDKTLEMKPTLTLDDGADLIFSVHDRPPKGRGRPGQRVGHTAIAQAAKVTEEALSSNCLQRAVQVELPVPSSPPCAPASSPPSAAPGPPAACSVPAPT